MSVQMLQAQSSYIPLHVVGKAKRPKYFRDLRIELLPVECCGQKNAWMNSEISHA